MSFHELLITCPWCDHEYSPEDSQEMIENFNWQGEKCVICGRKFRVLAQEQVVHVETSRYCFRGKCQWKPTISPDYEKCENCYDIRKVDAPVIASVLPTP